MSGQCAKEAVDRAVGHEATPDDAVVGITSRT